MARHRSENRWLVIELKRNQSSDETVGQILRYMGWMRRRKAEGAAVEGLIICREIDQRLQYTLDGLPNNTTSDGNLAISLHAVGARAAWPLAAVLCVCS